MVRMTKQTLDTNGVILNAKIEEVRVYREMDGGESCFVLTLTQDGQHRSVPHRQDRPAIRRT